MSGPAGRSIRDELAEYFGYDSSCNGTVAQLVEQGPFKALVLGSSPSRPTILFLYKSYGYLIYPNLFEASRE